MSEVRKPTGAPFKLTETRRDVLQLIADGRPLGDYVPRYRKGARRGVGAFPVTIAERAERELRRAGLVGESGITPAGRAALGAPAPDTHVIWIRLAIKSNADGADVLCMVNDMLDAGVPQDDINRHDEVKCHVVSALAGDDPAALDCAAGN